MAAILPGGAPQPATLGVLGGGQLGRMFVQAAQQLGYFTAVLDPDPASPAGLVAHYHVQADYLDEAGLAQMMQRCVAITTEFENVPAGALLTLGAHRPVAPDAAAVAICQDRGAEKAHFAHSGVACAPNATLESEAALAAVDATLLPGILKTARLGYDGKGQRRVATREELAAAWQALGGVPCVLEALLPIAFELSVIVARDADDHVVHLPVQRNLHRDGILAVTEVPALGIGEPLQRQAVAAAEQLARSMGYVGVLCVEFYVLSDGTLVANEMAPRPHNSGHYSIDACDVSQFELQVRTLAGLPLTAPRPQDGPPDPYRRHARERARQCLAGRAAAGPAGARMILDGRAPDAIAEAARVLRAASAMASGAWPSRIMRAPAGPAAARPARHWRARSRAWRR